MRRGLIEFHDYLARTGNVSQVLRVTDLRQAGLFLIRTQSGKIVFRVTERLQVVLGRRGKWSLCQEAVPDLIRAGGVIEFVFRASHRNGVFYHDIRTEGLLVKIDAGCEAQGTVEVLRNI